MSNSYPLLLGAELSGTGTHPQSWRRSDSRAEELFTAEYWQSLITSAEHGGFDLIFLSDSFALQENGARGRLDAVAVAARVAAATSRVGLIPQTSVTHTEPFHLAKAIASLDYATYGRAGWEVTVSHDAAQAALFGRKAAQDVASRWHEAAEAVDVVTRLWDSWEDDAEIRDETTGKFIDREKLHYIDFVGDNFSVKGPSITPRPPQGQPLVAVRADEPHSSRLAVRSADLVRISAPDLATAAESRRELRSAVAAAGRAPEQVRILLDVDVHLGDTVAAAIEDLARLDDWSTSTGYRRWRSAGLDHIGTRATLAELLEQVQLQGAADGVVLRPLAHTAFFDRLTEPVRTLRARIGLPKPVNRYLNVEG